MNLPPAELCDDATFLRRACLDVIGALPEPDEVKKFLQDRAEDKRAKKIDELLKRPGHAALWATKWCDVLRVRISYQDFTHQPALEGIRQFYEWVRARVQDNTPYDEFVARMVVSNSLDGRTRAQWFESVVRQYEESERDGPDEKRLVDRKTLELYWHRFDSTGVKGPSSSPTSSSACGCSARSVIGTPVTSGRRTTCSVSPTSSCASAPTLAC